jgi:hypothetical protein
MLQALYLCASFPLPISLYKAVGLHDRCVAWCESEIRLVVMLLFIRSLSGIFILCSTSKILLVYSLMVRLFLCVENKIFEMR